MDRRDTYFRQLVTDGNVDEWFDLAEADAHDRTAELGFMGVVTGLDVTEHSPNDLTVDVTGGTCFDADGQRIAVASTQNVDLSLDSTGSSTAVVASGKTKIVSLFAKFDRALSGVTQDGNGSNVYYNRDESFTFYVKQGAESSGTPTPPALEADGVLLADVTLAYGQTAITDSDIDTSAGSRRQDMFVVAGTAHTIREGTPLAALTALADIVDDHITATADKHAATDVTTTILGLWANGDAADKVAAGTVQTSLASIVSKLAATTTSHSGAHLLAVAAQTGSPGALAASDLWTRLELLRDATNLYCPARSAWLDSVANAAAGLYAAFNALVVDLSAYSASGRGAGAQKIGMALQGNFTSVSVQGCFAELTAVYSTNDGAKRVGAEVKGSFSANTVRGQLDELDTTRAKLAGGNTFTGTQTLSNAAVFDGTTDHNAAATFDSTADFNGSVTFDAGVDFNSTVSLDGAVTRTAAMTLSGSGATTATRSTSMSATTTSVTIDTSADVWYIDPSLASAYTVTLKSTSPTPPANAEIELVVYSPGLATVSAQREGGTEIIQYGAGSFGSARYKFLGGSWRLLSCSGDAITISNP